LISLASAPTLGRAMSERAPIPPPLDADPEDVFWALSTATTLFGRGERFEALKWLRRAAQSASDLGTDTRALELMKAAADLTASLGAPPASLAPPPGRASTPPPLPKKPPQAAPSASAAPRIPAAPPIPQGRPAPAAQPPALPADVQAVLAANAVQPPRVTAPSKLPRNMSRERSGTLTGRRGLVKRTGSSADLTKIARAALGDSYPDLTGDDDLEEVTKVLDGKRPVGGVRQTGARKGVIFDDPKAAKQPAPKPAVPAPPVPAAAPVKPPSVPAPPLAARPVPAPIAAKPQGAPAPAKPVVAAPTPVVVEKPAASRPLPTMVRKGTMQLVDEAFESLLGGVDEPAMIEVTAPAKIELKEPAKIELKEPAKIELKEPAKIELKEPAPAVVEKAAPAGLLAQRVAVIVGPGGEARLVRLEGDAVPEGAIVVVVVPLAPADGERLARLLG
jgi:hypothetical protein